MTRKVYRWLAVVSLGFLILNIAQHDWLGKILGSPVSIMPVNEKTYITIQWSLGNVILGLMTLGLVYLGRSQRPN